MTSDEMGSGRMEKDYREMLVEDVYNLVVSRPAKVRKGASIADALDAIVSTNTSKVYVVDDKEMVVGTITVESLLRHAGYRVNVREPGIVPFFRFLVGILKDVVDDIMAAPVTVKRGDALLQAMRTMAENHLNDLPVVDDDGRLIGELNSTEILRIARGWYHT